jgi:DNA-binding Lrp family transcriptional regulator
LKDVELRLIAELVKNSRRSDRQLAKAIGTSQPTVSRTIKKLEKEGLLDYTAVPDLKKLGFEILAFTFGKWNFQKNPDTHVDEMKKFIDEHPNLIFVSTGAGLGSDRVGISVHKDYSDYSRVIQDFKTEFGEYYESLSSFIISLRSDTILRSITFKFLTKLLEDQEQPLA